jgi:putative hydrolase of the HAD superfamily
MASGKTFKEIKSKFTFDEVFQSFERGELNPTQFRKLISERIDINLTDEEFDKGWCHLYMDEIQGVDKLLSDLKRKYQLLALSNTNEIHARVWKVKYAPILEHFMKIFSSNEMRTRKPETEIYQMLIDYLGLKPEQIVFLDDMPGNTISAGNLGIKTVTVSSFPQMKKDLEELLSLNT